MLTSSLLVRVCVQFYRCQCFSRLQPMLSVQLQMLIYKQGLTQVAHKQELAYVIRHMHTSYLGGSVVTAPAPMVR